MELIKLLQENSESIIAESLRAIHRAHLRHYEKAGEKAVQARLKSLFDLTLQCVREKNLMPLISNSNEIAHERFNSGFDLHEVQTAFNVIEETIWKFILTRMPQSEFPEAIGLITTVLSAGKDALARTYVSLASKTKVSSLDLGAMFDGTGG